MQTRIQVSGKDFETGKPKLYTKRIYNTDNLTEAKFRKYAEKQAMAYEEEVDRQYAEHTHAVRNKIPTFAELYTEWCNNLRANASMSHYRHSVSACKKFNDYLVKVGLDKKPITEIRVRDVQLFLNSFTETQPRKPRVVLIKELPSAINLRELARDGVISRHISWDMKKKNISKEYAEKLCKQIFLAYVVKVMYKLFGFLYRKHFLFVDGPQAHIRRANLCSAYGIFGYTFKSDGYCNKVYAIDWRKAFRNDGREMV